MFYTHPRMADGHLNKCKSCAKKDVQKRYASPEGRKKVVAYDRLREQTAYRKLKKAEYQRRRRAASPGKYRANAMVAKALKDGRLVQKPCQVCGESKSEAHHEDYRKPLDVMWLCFKHHREAHGQIVGATPL